MQGQQRFRPHQPGSGWDGVPFLHGPYVVDYTDIPHDGDKVTLWTPAVGDVLLRIIADPTTGVEWDHGHLFVGQNPIVGGGPPYQSVFAFTDTSGLGFIDISEHGVIYTAGGASPSATAYVFHSATAVSIMLAQTGGNDPTAGHVEIYCLVARAVAP